MPHKGSSPRTLDLFEYTMTVPTPRSDPALASAELWELAGLSDAQLATHLGQLLDELQRRMEAGRGSGPELKAAVKLAMPSYCLSDLFRTHRNTGSSPHDSARAHPHYRRANARRCGLPFWREWRRHKSRSTLACRLPPSARCLQRPRRLPGRAGTLPT